jgi:hypothetical protein
MPWEGSERRVWNKGGRIISKPKTRETERKTKFIVLLSTTNVISNHRRLNPRLHTAKSMPIASPMEQEPTHFF